MSASGVDGIRVVSLCSSFTRSRSGKSVVLALVGVWKEGEIRKVSDIESSQSVEMERTGREGSVSVYDGTGETTVVLSDSKGREGEEGNNSESRAHVDKRSEGGGGNCERKIDMSATDRRR